jgi:hypothetical protein
MRKSQVPPWQPEMLALSVERLGPLPLINHFLERLALEAHLERFVPTSRRRTRLPYTKGLGILLRSLLVEREPLYRQGCIPKICHLGLSGLGKFRGFLQVVKLGKRLYPLAG